ncbi:Subtilisin-like protease SBT2.4 [Glycine soja]
MNMLGSIIICTFSAGFNNGTSTLHAIIGTSKALGLEGFILVANPNYGDYIAEPIPFAVSGIMIPRVDDDKVIFQHYEEQTKRDRKGTTTEFGAMATVGEGRVASFTGRSPIVSRFSSTSPNIIGMHNNLADVLKTVQQKNHGLAMEELINKTQLSPKIIPTSSCRLGGSSTESHFLHPTAVILLPRTWFVIITWCYMGSLNPHQCLRTYAKRHNFSLLSGTSMSTPHVAGIAALIKQYNPLLTPAMIASAISTTSSKYDNLGEHMMAEGFEASSLLPSTPFEYGVGFVSPNCAIDPGLLLESNDALTQIAGVKLDGTSQLKNILVTAASGGVGHYTDQLAKLILCFRDPEYKVQTTTNLNASLVELKNSLRTVIARVNFPLVKVERNNSTTNE